MREMQGVGIYGAVVGIAAVALGGASVLEIGIAWVVLLAVNCVTTKLGTQERETKRGWVIGMLIVWIAGILMVLEDTFPQKSTYPFVSLGMVLLLYRQLIGSRETGRYVRNIIGLAIVPIMIVLGLCGIPNLQYRELAVQGLRWDSVIQAAAIMIPLCSSIAERKWKLPALLTLLGISVLTHGVLGGYLAETMNTALYKAIGAIRVSGKLIHIESLLSAVILMGGFGMLSYLGDKAVVEEQISRGKAASICVLVFVVEFLLRGIVEMSGGRLEWVIWSALTAIGLIVECGNRGQIIEVKTTG